MNVKVVSEDFPEEQRLLLQERGNNSHFKSPFEISEGTGEQESTNVWTDVVFLWEFIERLYERT